MHVNNKLRLYEKIQQQGEKICVYKIKRATRQTDSKEEHDNSLKVDGVRELIMKAMPLLDGQPTKGQEIEILGGTGI